ncbi:MULTISPECIES: VOC family protein [Nocardia]|uniref:lactoylglutathione lyase n=1 Tax=Nocardia TaxID=1817 RepID=UPI000D6860AD|nr:MULTISPECIES: lactoylglutathione lyase [Nocardia]
MTSPFTMLLSGDLMVKDADRMAELLTAKVGVYGHPNWRQAFPGHPYVAHFLRTHKSLAVAPTRIEPQGHLDAPNQGDPMFPIYLHSLEEFQGPTRPIKTHATVLITDDLEGMVQRLHERKVPFRVARLTPEMPFDRIWLGCRPEDPRYRPEIDGGLCVEIMAAGPLQLPDAAYDVPPPEPRHPRPTDLVRVVARGFLVRDLHDVLSRLRANLDWEPVTIEEFPDEGLRRARMGFALGHSGTLDLIEPTKWATDEGRYLYNWGPGPYYIRLSAIDLDAKEKDLAERGTRFSRITLGSAGGELLRIDPDELDGALIEIVAHQG